MKIIILGCGSSVGVPSIGCRCDVCKSDLRYNKRTRTSALIQHKSTNILIDASPDLRIQALKNKFNSVDGVLFTHSHVDHCAGIHELQAFSPKNKLHYIPIYSDFMTLRDIVSSRPYFFIPNVPTSPWNRCYYITNNVIGHYSNFNIGDCNIVAIKQFHGDIESNGFIFNDELAYCTDVKSFPEKSWRLLFNKKILVLGCLRHEETKAHAHVSLCIEWIKKLKPQRAILTHLSHYIDYKSLYSDLYEYRNEYNIVPAHDGLTIEL